MKAHICIFKSHCCSPLVVALVWFTVFFSSCQTKAQITAPLQEIEGKAYYMHTVEKGQTLYGVSRLYKCDINDIAAANPGADQGLKEGAVLRIPAEKARAGTAVVRADQGKVYFEHEVEKKETLFSIAQRYQLDVNELIAANPGADKGLKKGQLLKVPIKAAPKEVKEEPLAPGLMWHEVQQGETLFSVAKKFGSTVEALQNLNGGLVEGLKAGARIKVPQPADSSVPAPKPLISGEAIKDSYNIALCLPFFTDAPDSVVLTEKEKRQREVAVNMLRGVRMACSRLEKEGMQADVFVENIGDEKSQVANLVKKEAFKGMDMVIGPTFRDPMFEMANWASKNDVHLVCPVPQSNKILLTSSNVSKIAASDAAIWEHMGEIVGKKYKNEQVILVNSGVLEDARQVQVFYDAFMKAAGDSCNLYKVSSKSATGIATFLSSSKRNIIVAPLSDKAIVASLFKAVSKQGTVFFGPEEWETMEAITPEFRERFEVQFVKSTWIDYANPRVQEWVEDFRKTYKSEPTEYAFIGYDMMLYYGRGLKLFGKLFPEHFAEIDQAGLLANGFDFFKTGAESGYENRHVFILTNEDYQVVKTSLTE
jgi:LysM repeat protein/ABC-type branched-subunit amino acid transport system substrate-binding protein